MKMEIETLIVLTLFRSPAKTLIMVRHQRTRVGKPMTTSRRSQASGNPLRKTRKRAAGKKVTRAPAKVFLSYAHEDEQVLGELRRHLSMLKREGIIAELVDQEIPPGDDLDEGILGGIDSCDLFLPLVSSSFLASDYCYETEMTRAFARQDAREIRIVPIVIEPCDWMESPLQNLKALPKDGRPVSEWPDRNAAFLDVVEGLRRLLLKASVGLSASADEPFGEPTSPTSQSYRIKRDFNEIDRSDFRDKVFREFREYFQAGIDVLDRHDGLRARCTDMSHKSFTCTVVNCRKGNTTAHITVHAGGGRMSLGDIYFSFEENASKNTANGSFYVRSDDYELFLESGIFGMTYEDKRVSSQEAAASVWEQFIRQAGISPG